MFFIYICKKKSNIMRYKTDQATEERIKDAAGTLFTLKGYSSTTMRDIAAQAEVNLALVNYYFRSKENIFKIIMREKIQTFFNSIFPYLFDEQTSLQEKFTSVVEKYINTISQDPNLPLFVFGEIQKNPEEISSLFPMLASHNDILRESSFFKQLHKINPHLNPFHFILNFLGITIFPFIASPLLVNFGMESSENMKTIMEERKKLIPQWMNQMLLIE